jgi:hypothetical protein
LKGVILLVEKERTVPIVIQILRALLRRLPVSHPKYQQILEELARREAGYNGEKSLDYYYRSLPQKKYMIFHDLNLPDGEYNCQIDTLLVTSERILIIDAKNMRNKLIFDTENEQFMQINNEHEKGYQYPIAQAERHQQYIKELLAEHKLPPLPVDYLVVITNEYATYNVTGKNAHKVKPRICKADVLLNRLEFFKKLYPNEVCSTKDLRKLSRLLLKMDTPPTSQILRKFEIGPSELLTGVHCTACLYLPMIRKNRKWYCPSCGTFSKNAHINAIMDHFLLIGPEITNRKFRAFVHLSSIDTAGRMLRSANLSYSGNKRQRIYFPKNRD